MVLNGFLLVLPFKICFVGGAPTGGSHRAGLVVSKKKGKKTNLLFEWYHSKTIENYGENHILGVL